MTKKRKWWNGKSIGIVTRVAARSFAPHSFETKVKFSGGLPRILITKEALDRMYHYVDIATQEVGWLGTCRQEGSDFLIEQVFLFEQEVSHTSTEISVEGLSKFSEEILTTHPEDAMEILNSLRFWGHSHVNMGTNPSQTDEDQMRIFAESGHEFFIRAILNKAGRMEFTLFLYAAGVTLTDVEWNVITLPDATLREEIEAEMKTKVTGRIWTYTPPISTFGSYHDIHSPTEPLLNDPHNYGGGDH